MVRAHAHTHEFYRTNEGWVVEKKAPPTERESGRGLNLLRLSCASSCAAAARARIVHSQDKTTLIQLDNLGMGWMVWAAIILPYPAAHGGRTHQFQAAAFKLYKYCIMCEKNYAK